jgi:glycosyltransferase involved in cell wall biosynthesis
VRIAQVIETMNMGGAEKLAVNVANELAARGHESHLIVTTQRGELSTQIADGVTAHYLEFDRSSIANPIKFFNSIRHGRALLSKVVHDNLIEVIQTHLPGSNFFGLMLARSKACAVLPTIHNNEEFRYGASDLKLLVAIRKYAYRNMLKRCQQLIAVSPTVRSSMIKELGCSEHEAKRISVVTNAVPIPEPVDDARRFAIRREFGVRDDETLILAAGRFCEQKNHQDLIRVAAELVHQQVPFRVLIAGDGELKSEVEAAIGIANLGSNVICPGNLQNLGDVMLAADIFVMTSLWEGLPLVLLESMASGLPTVAYAIDGINEVVVDGHTGAIVPVGHIEDMANQIARLSSQTGERETLGAASRELITIKFSFLSFVDELLDLYTQGMSEFRSSR